MYFNVEVVSSSRPIIIRPDCANCNASAGSQIICKFLVPKPFNAHSGQKQPDNFDKTIIENIFEGSQFEHFQQLSFKYFVKIELSGKIIFNSKVIANVSIVDPDNNF